MKEKSGRGWGAAAGLALAAAMFSVVSPGLLIFVPLTLLLVALPPRRPALVALGAVLAVVAFWGPGDRPLWYIERGWALVLGAWFVVMVVAWPRAAFLPRALAAVGASLVSAVLLFQVTHGGWAYLDWMVSRHLRAAASAMTALWGAAAGAEAWAPRISEGIYQAAELQALLHPALLALASLAGLGVAWWGYRRLAARERSPFAPFREFRFSNELVWILIAGVLLVVLPLGEVATRAGSNVLAFMGALYALRGAAVLLALAGAPGIGGALFGVLMLLFLPMVMLTTVLVGLTDTWLDLRARRSAVRRGS